MRKTITTFRNFTPEGETFIEKSKTIPNQTLSIKQIVKRQGTGLLGYARQSQFFDNEEMHTIMQMDKIDRIDFLRNVNQDVTTLKNHLELINKQKIKDAIQKNMDKIDIKPTPPADPVPIQTSKDGSKSTK